MKIISKTGLVSLVVAVALVVGGASVFAKGKKGGKVCHGAKGTVTAVDSSSITVETKKKGAKQFQLTASTVYERKGKKGQPNTPAALTEVQQGEHVHVTAAGGKATKVVFKKKHHKKNK